MFCKKCGTQIPDDSAYCPKCGENLNNASVCAPIPEKKSSSNTTKIFQYVFTGLALLEIFWAYYANYVSSLLADDVAITVLVFATCAASFLIFGLFLFAPAFLKVKKWLSVIFYALSPLSAIFIALFNVTYSDAFAISGFAAAGFVIASAICANASNLAWAKKEKIAFTSIYLAASLVLICFCFYFNSASYALNRGVEHMLSGFAG